MKEIRLCPLCEVGEGVSRHHETPKSKGGKLTILICEGCHKQIHMLFNNGDLASQYNSIEKLSSHPSIQKWVMWRRKHPNARISFSESKSRKLRN